jgi:cobalt/nickel transport system permease protein
MSAVHRLPAHVKVVAALLFVLGVVATPRTAFVAFAIDGAAVVFVAGAAGLHVTQVVKRLAIELPFVAFALLLPFVVRGPQVAVGPVALSVDGLWAAWNILAKGTLGVAVAVVLSATTPVADLLTGLQRLRVPPAFCAIGGFMVRYGAVLGGELERLRVARISRGDDPRWLWQARSVATGAGALFVRSYERGERVQVAMAARGFEGTWPQPVEPAVSATEWLVALAVAVVAVGGATAALGLS